MSSPSRAPARQLWTSEAGEIPATPERPGMNLACWLLDMIVDANKEIVHRHIVTIARDFEAKSKILPLKKALSLRLR